MRTLALILTLIVLSVGVCEGVEREESWQMRDLFHKRESQGPVMTAVPDTLHDFDVLSYDLKIRFYLTAESLAGTTAVLIRSDVAALDSVSLDLTQLSVERIWMGARDLAFSHNGDLIEVALDTAISYGDTFGFNVAYHGEPGNEGPGGFGGFWFTPRTAYSMGVGLRTDPPSMGRYWFPCYDKPHDKAEFDMSFTVPMGKVAVSNGVLVDTVTNVAESTITYTWSEHHPTSTYLVAVSISDYVIVPDSVYAWIYHYVYPEDSADAITSFKNVHRMMDAFENSFASYQFDRFSFVATPNGDMEHQTCVSHYYLLINGINNYDWILAHELAHHWWGDWVTVADWRDVWLSEGFATYCEAVYQEYLGGWQAYHDYVVSDIMNYYLVSGEFFPIYDPLSMWSATTYEKAASVLHMLRHVVSDSTFFEILNSYGDQYSFSNAVTPNFQAVCESIYGQDLDWFFNEWIYDWGYPRYTYQYWQEGADSVTVIVGQEQLIGPTFVMPVDIRLGKGMGDTVVVAWIDESPESLTFVFPGAGVDSFSFDPDDWVLKQARQLPGVTEDVSRASRSTARWRLVVQPNPCPGTAALTLFSPQGQSKETPACLTIYDVAGRPVRTFSLAEYGPAGKAPVGSDRYDLLWDGRDERGLEVASGVYICLLDVNSGASPEKLILLR